MLKLCTDCHHVHRAEVHCPRCARPKTAGALATGVVLLGLSLTGCDGQEEDVALYGAPVEDADGDGYFEDADCDDSDANINPDAEETPGDGVDSNCDGEDDT